jgi:hypothetical protein
VKAPTTLLTSCQAATAVAVAEAMTITNAPIRKRLTTPRPVKVSSKDQDQVGAANCARSQHERANTVARRRRAARPEGTHRRLCRCRPGVLPLLVQRQRLLCR